MRSHCEPRARAAARMVMSSVCVHWILRRRCSGVADASPAAAVTLIIEGRDSGEDVTTASGVTVACSRRRRTCAGNRGRVVYDRVIWHWRMLLLPLS